MPQFISYDPVLFSYTINPTLPATEIGTFKVMGTLSDSNMETDFKFDVTVYNDPPYFKSRLVSTINVAVGSNFTYILPEAEDKEGMAIIMTS
jgi:hypothetical protein